jgi:hypothetical protein
MGRISRLKSIFELDSGDFDIEDNEDARNKNRAISLVAAGALPAVEPGISPDGQMAEEEMGADPLHSKFMKRAHQEIFQTL